MAVAPDVAFHPAVFPAYVRTGKPQPASGDGFRSFPPRSVLSLSLGSCVSGSVTLDKDESTVPVEKITWPGWLADWGLRLQSKTDLLKESAPRFCFHRSPTRRGFPTPKHTGVAVRIWFHSTERLPSDGPVWDRSPISLMMDELALYHPG